MASSKRKKLLRFFNMTKDFLRKLTVFDWLVVFVVLATLAFFSSYLFRVERWVEVEVLVSPEKWWWQAESPPFWLAESIEIGDNELDAFGRKVAEVADYRIYEKGGSTKDVYLKLNLKIGIDKRKKKLVFKNRPLEVGSPIELNLSNTLINGMVTYVQGLPDKRKTVEKKIKAKWMDIFPSQAEIVTIGSKMQDGQGRAIAEILDKKVSYAEKTILETESGDRLYVTATDPLRRDVVLTIWLLTKEQGGILYFTDNQKIKVGERIWIYFPEIDIQGALITEILE